MKGVIAFDSYFGNTRSVAEAMKEEIERTGHEAALLNLRTSREVPSEGDFLMVGSPTRFKKMTRPAKRLVKKLDAKAWGAKPVAVFDTFSPYRGDDPKKAESSKKWVDPGAAGFLIALAEKRGLKVRTPPLRCSVKDMKGPLDDGELDRAREYARQFASSLGK
jgi:flavodoxin